MFSAKEFFSVIIQWNTFVEIACHDYARTSKSITTQEGCIVECMTKRKHFAYTNHPVTDERDTNISMLENPIDGEYNYCTNQCRLPDCTEMRFERRALEHVKNTITKDLFSEITVVYPVLIANTKLKLTLDII